MPNHAQKAYAATSQPQHEMEASGQLHARAAFTPRKKLSDSYWLGDWMGLGAVL
jgi:hypothetical protein